MKHLSKQPDSFLFGSFIIFLVIWASSCFFIRLLIHTWFTAALKDSAVPKWPLTSLLPGWWCRRPGASWCCSHRSSWCGGAWQSSSSLRSSSAWERVCPLSMWGPWTPEGDVPPQTQTDFRTQVNVCHKMSAQMENCGKLNTRSPPRIPSGTVFKNIYIDQS